MKIFISALLVLAISCTNWEGTWTVSQSNITNENCCVPALNSFFTIKPDSSNHSQIFVNAEWVSSSICNNLGWESGKSVPFPWNVNNIQPLGNTSQFSGAQGLEYKVKVNLESDDLQALMQIDMTSVNGDSDCQFKIIQAPTWEGTWYLLQPCDPSSCCCPTSQQFTISSNPTNNSEILVNAEFNQNNPICNKLNWHSGKPVAWPWSPAYDFDFYIPTTYSTGAGVKFMLATIEFDNQTLYSQMHIDQSAVGGNKQCTLKINNAPPVWSGHWGVNYLTNCDPNSCCCPTPLSPVNIEANRGNSSQIFVTANWVNNQYCSKLGWYGNSEVTFPIPNSNLPLNSEQYFYNGVEGLKFSFNSSELYNQTYVVDININQASIGGSSTCNFEMNNNPPTWLGKWIARARCGILECCCMLEGSPFNVEIDPTNSSQIVISGAEMMNTEVCQSIGWDSHTSYVFPWSAYDLILNDENYEYFDSKGVGYTLTMKMDLNGTFTGYILMNQESVGGSSYCRTPVNNHYQN